MWAVLMWVAVGLMVSLLIALVIGRGLRRLDTLDRQRRERERRERRGRAA